ncbi:MAG: hypothetical protein MZW92_41475 [Comamonadaceae bacterium]|nr:hypothetical protein [Comamonadaceae bacterium]
MDWLHLTGITPAISAAAAALTVEAAGAARAQRMTVSLDLNYRSKLWKYGPAGPRGHARAGHAGRSGHGQRGGLPALARHRAGARGRGGAARSPACMSTRRPRSWPPSPTCRGSR